MQTERTNLLPLFCLISVLAHLAFYFSPLGAGGAREPDLPPPGIEVTLVPPKATHPSPQMIRRPLVARPHPRRTGRIVRRIAIAERQPPRRARVERTLVRRSLPRAKATRVARTDTQSPVSEPVAAEPRARDLGPQREAAPRAAHIARAAGAATDIMPPNRSRVPTFVLPSDPRRLVQALNDAPRIPDRSATVGLGPVRVRRPAPGGGSVGLDAAPSGRGGDRIRAQSVDAPPEDEPDPKSVATRGDLTLPGPHMVPMPGNEPISATKLLSPLAGLNDGSDTGLPPGGNHGTETALGRRGGRPRIRREGRTGSEIAGTGSGVGPGEGRSPAGEGHGRDIDMPDPTDDNGYGDGPAGHGKGHGAGNGSGGGVGDGTGEGFGPGAGGGNGERGTYRLAASRGTLFASATSLLGGSNSGQGSGDGPSRGGLLQVRPALAPGGRLKIVYALDTSGSMAHGDKIGKAQAALKRALSELQPDDSFDIITFNDDVHSLSDTLLPATPENIRAGIDYIDGIHLGFGTLLSGALEAALSVPGATEIFVASDGEPVGGIEDFRQLRAFVRKKNVQKARITTLAIGQGEKFFGIMLLKGLAEDNGGTYTYVNTDLVPTAAR